MGADGAFGAEPGGQEYQLLPVILGVLGVSHAHVRPRPQVSTRLALVQLLFFSPRCICGFCEGVTVSTILKKIRLVDFWSTLCREKYGHINSYSYGSWNNFRHMHTT